MLKTVYVGKKAGGVAQVENFSVFSGDRVVLIDATTGKSPKKISTKLINKNLHIFEEGSSEPSAILGDYETYQNTVHISGMESSGQYVDYAQTSTGVMELGGTPMATTPPPSEPLLSMNAIYGIGILAGVGVAVAAAGGGGGDSTTTTTTTVVDPAAPTATIAMSDSVLNSTETSVVTITFSEAVSGFTNADVTAQNGTLSTFTSADNITWTAVFTPSADTADTTNVISLAAGSYTSTATGKAGAAATSDNYVVDTTVIPPASLTVAITDDESGIANIAGEDVRYTFTFSEPVASFAAGGITVTNGTAGTFQQLSSTVFTLDVTPNAGFEGNMTVDVAAGSALTSSGNANLAAYTSVQPVDTVAPTATVALLDSALLIGGTTTVTVTFTEAVAGFSNGDVIAPNGTLSTFTSADNKVWTALFTPTANISDASNVVQLLSTYTDTALNAGALAQSANYTIDTRVAPIAAPTIALTSDVGSSTTDGITSVNGVTVSGITETNWEYSLDGGAIWTAGSGTSFNLVTNTSYAAGDVQVRQYTETANKSTIATNTQTWLVDTTLPVLTIVDDEDMATANLDGSNADGTTDANGADILYTFTFDEAVKDFDSGDVVVTNGTKGTFTKISDTVYTLAVTPNDGFEGDMTVSVATTAYHDAAGNAGDVTSDTVLTQAVDMRAPFPDPLVDTDGHIFTAGNINFITPDSEFQRLILKFDENLEQVNQTSPTNFGVMINGDSFKVEAIGVSDNAVGMADNEVFLYLEPIVNARGESFDWRTAGITVSYTDGATDLTSVIQDLAGNDATSFNDYLVDQLAPNAKITMSDTILSSGDTPTVTFAFSEKVTLNLTDLDLTQANGTMDTLTTADGGKTWVGTFTPSTGVQDSTNIITLNTTYKDDAGNSGTAATSVNYSIDTKAPTLTTVSANGTVDTITLTFDEALDSVNFATTDMFYVTDGTLTPDPADGSALLKYSIEAISISGNTATLTVDPTIVSTAGTTWIVTYVDQPGNDAQALQDIYGSDVSSFTRTAVI